MSGKLIVALVGAFVAVMLEVVPGLKSKWSGWSWKALTLLIVFLGVPAAIWAIVCYGGINVRTVVLCGVQGLLEALWLGFIAFLGNQVGYTALASKTANAEKRHELADVVAIGAAVGRANSSDRYGVGDL